MTILFAALFVVGCDKDDEVGQRLVNVEVYKVENLDQVINSAVQYNVYHDESLNYYSLITFSEWDAVTIGEYAVTDFADATDSSAYSFTFTSTAMVTETVVDEEENESEVEVEVVTKYSLFASTIDTTYPGRYIGTMDVTVGEEETQTLDITVYTENIQILYPE